jgi:hypothetical protein
VTGRRLSMATTFNHGRDGPLEGALAAAAAAAALRFSVVRLRLYQVLISSALHLELATSSSRAAPLGVSGAFAKAAHRGGQLASLPRSLTAP